MVYRHSPLQLSFESFGAGLSTPLSSNNEWIQLAEVMPWKALDEAYQLEFTKNAGRAAKPFRLLYGAILIQQYSTRQDRSVGPIQSGHRHHGRNRSASQNQVSSRHRPPQPSKAES